MFTTKPRHELEDAAGIDSPTAGHNAATAGSSIGKPVRSVISPDLSFTGNMVDTGEIEFLGKLEGDVQCGSILIGEKAEILGTVTAEDVVVRGRVVGLIKGLRVTLEAQAHVEGEIHYQSLGMEHGVHFDGKGRRLEAPLTAKTPAEKSAAAPAEGGARLELLHKKPQSEAAE